jgi:hypothetical protein
MDDSGNGKPGDDRTNGSRFGLGIGVGIGVVLARSARPK